MDLRRSAETPLRKFVGFAEISNGFPCMNIMTAGLQEPAITMREINDVHLPFDFLAAPAFQVPLKLSADASIPSPRSEAWGEGAGRGAMSRVLLLDNPAFPS
jgi:hypothetical protein